MYYSMCIDAQWSLNEPNFEYNETFVLCIMSLEMSLFLETTIKFELRLYCNNSLDLCLNYDLITKPILPPPRPIIIAQIKKCAQQIKEVCQYFDTRLSKHLYLTLCLLTQSDESYFPILDCFIPV